MGPSGGYVLEDQKEALQLGRALKDMDAIGIKTMLVSGLQALMGGPVEGNDLIESLLKPHADRFQGYVTYNPNYGSELIPQLDRYFKGPVFAGFKTLCDYWSTPITDPRFKPMWEYASRHRLPVLNHTWEGACNSPSQFKDIAAKYPNVPLLLGHSGGGNRGRTEAVELSRTNKYVYLEWCGQLHQLDPVGEDDRRVAGQPGCVRNGCHGARLQLGNRPAAVAGCARFGHCPDIGCNDAPPAEGPAGITPRVGSVQAGRCEAVK